MVGFVRCSPVVAMLSRVPVPLGLGLIDSYDDNRGVTEPLNETLGITPYPDAGTGTIFAQM